jgi:hypothetical protein
MREDTAIKAQVMRVRELGEVIWENLMGIDSSEWLLMRNKERFARNLEERLWEPG